MASTTDIPWVSARMNTLMASRDELSILPRAVKPVRSESSQQAYDESMCKDARKIGSLKLSLMSNLLVVNSTAELVNHAITEQAPSFRRDNTPRQLPRGVDIFVSLLYHVRRAAHEEVDYMDRHR
mmetsp:Transcript_6257/g.22894  ORF Transcript_6257/g.22894 Transcript_6257/m.22894 type:complete len:125 (-) Transcript_6257:214-588(-)